MSSSIKNSCLLREQEDLFVVQNGFPRVYTRVGKCTMFTPRLTTSIHGGKTAHKKRPPKLNIIRELFRNGILVSGTSNCPQRARVHLLAARLFMATLSCLLGLYALLRSMLLLVVVQQDSTTDVSPELSSIA